ncbi:MAG: MarC family protein [Bacteroidota bacterium]|nr:MarC family protein [Bacteroidota bacterium]
MMTVLNTLFTLRLEYFASVFVTLLALINPVQKIFLITSLQERLNEKELRFLSVKASITAFFILIVFLTLGNAIFGYIFKIELYSFRVTCGMVLLYNGWIALQKGVLIKISKDMRVQDVSSVPVAVPMIAGPGTITASVTFPAQYGVLLTIIAIFSALMVNMVIMLYAQKIGKVMIRLNIMSALVRIIGLIIATIGIQMMFDGVYEFIRIHGL